MNFIPDIFTAYQLLVRILYLIPITYSALAEHVYQSPELFHHALIHYFNNSLFHCICLSSTVFFILNFYCIQWEFLYQYPYRGCF